MLNGSEIGLEFYLLELAKRCKTVLGTHAFTVLAPFQSASHANRRIGQVEALCTMRQRGAQFHVGRWESWQQVERCAFVGDVMTGEELAFLKGDLSEALHWFKRVRPGELAGLGCTRSAWEALLPLAERLNRSISDKGELLDSASTALAQGRRALRGAVQTRKQQAQRFVSEDNGWLQDSFFTHRDDRIVFPARTDRIEAAQGVIVHDVSQTKQTSYVEPRAFVQLNNQVISKRRAVEAEELRLLREMSGEVALLEKDLKTVAYEIGQMDMAHVLCLMSEQHGWSALADGKSIQLKRCRHPNFDLQGQTAVCNDFVLPMQKGALVSGPNAGGKTVLLKTVALAAWSRRHGFYFPAEQGSTVPWFDFIEVVIGDHQDLQEKHSSYSGRLRIFADLLETAGKKHLVLVDEVATGTDPEQGQALAQAWLEALATQGVTTIATLHGARLKELGASHPGFCNYAVGVHPDTGEPTFSWVANHIGYSGAMLAAKRAGIHKDVLDRAQALLNEGAVELEHSAEQLDRMKHELELAQDKLSDEQVKVQRARVHLEDQKSRWAQKLQKAEQEMARHVRRELAEMNAQVKALRKRARKRLENGEPQEVEELAEKARAVLKEVNGLEFASETVAEGVPYGVGEAPAVGDDVFVPKVGLCGSIVRQDGKRFQVQVGSMTMWLEGEHLQKFSGEKDKKLPEYRGAGNVGLDLASSRWESGTCDVRGRRLDEALRVVSKFIDDAILQGIDEVCVVHGHGTDTLKKAIRRAAKNNKVVVHYEAAPQELGGDGATILALDA